MFTSIMICAVCDLAISGGFSWSLIAMSSILYAWVIIIPTISYGKAGIRKSLVSLTLSTLPYLFVLQRIIESEPRIFLIGSQVFAVSIIYLWIAYFLFRNPKGRFIRSSAIALLLFVVLHVAINAILARILGQSLFDIWDMIGIASVVSVSTSLLLVDTLVRSARSQLTP